MLNKYLIDLLKKSRLRKPIGTEVKYSPETKLWTQTISTTSFGNQQPNYVIPSDNNPIDETTTTSTTTTTTTEAPTTTSTTSTTTTAAYTLGIWNLIVPDGETVNVYFVQPNGSSFTIPVTGPVNENNCLLFQSAPPPATVTKTQEGC